MNTLRSVISRAIAGLFVALQVSCGAGGGHSLTMSVEPTTITLGQSATITWQWKTPEGGFCEASGAWSGDRKARGNEIVTPPQTGTLTYALKCSAWEGFAIGKKQTASVTLTVNKATGFTQTSLVAGFAGSAAVTTDGKLRNPRGIAFAADGPAWVASRGAARAYDGNGKPQSSVPELISDRRARAALCNDGQTGIVSAASEHVVARDGLLSLAELVYATKAGMICGWAPAIDPANALAMYADTDGAVYTGLTIANDGNETFLYAADFHNNKIDVFDTDFTKQSSSSVRFAFRDSTLPAGYAPFGIQAIHDVASGDQLIWVTYARQLPPDDYDHAVGAGLGLVNAFDTSGRLIRRLVPPGGALNAPWGMALAPADFGVFSRSLLVANSGDGRVHAYEPATGAFLGSITEAGGRPIEIPGLWGIAFGNDTDSQPNSTLFFAAGLDETDGRYGRIDVGAALPTLEY